jgi:sortase A
MINRERAHKTLEHAVLAIGVLCLGVFVGDLSFRELSSNQALHEFDEARAAGESAAVLPALDVALEAPDFRLWTGKRIQAYRQGVAAATASPLAVIAIPKLNLRVPVYAGTDEQVLNRGAGWIAGTASPGESGNIGIAGHRDSFFRGLKDLSYGDAIEVSTIRDSAVYTVDQIQIVSPTNVSVLGPRAAPSVTLVTCYPFYFIGRAPKRYVLHATLERREAAIP